MNLRPQLLPPLLDEDQVQRLSRLADALDGFTGNEGERQELVDRFNGDARTEFEFRDFHGIYGSASHETWVRTQLSLPAARPIPDVTREELVELVRRISNGEGAEHEVNFWMSLLQANVPDPHVSDLIFWPNVYFKDESVSELTPEEIVDTALAHKPTPLPRSVSD